MVMNPPPPTPQEYGSTTPSVAAAAIAASTALPPRRSVWIAARVATGSTVAAAPPVPMAVGCFAGAVWAAAAAGRGSSEAAAAATAGRSAWSMPRPVPRRPHLQPVRHALCQRALQRLVEVRVREDEPQRLRAGRDGALAARDDLGHVAVQQAHRERGDRRDRGAVERAPEALRELAVGDRLGRGRVDRPGPRLAVQRGEVEGDEVVDGDPPQG